MIRSTIVFALSNFPLTFFIVGLIAAALSLLFHRAQRSRAQVREEVFAYFLLFPLGISFLYNFVMHVFWGDMTARSIGWPDSPFQAELGFACLGFAYVAFLAFRGSHGLRIGAVVGPSIFLLAAAARHIRQMIVDRNFAPGNAGVVFYMDIVIPLVGLILLGLEGRDMRAGAAGESPIAA